MGLGAELEIVDPGGMQITKEALERLFADWPGSFELGGELELAGFRLPS